VGLVLEDGGDLTELVAVLASVVSAEVQLETVLELHPEIGLGSATVASVSSTQGCCAGDNGGVHVDLSSYVGVWLNVGRGPKIPTPPWCSTPPM
jgi:hypothetical protein